MPAGNTSRLTMNKITERVKGGRRGEGGGGREEGGERRGERGGGREEGGERRGERICKLSESWVLRCVGALSHCVCTYSLTGQTLFHEVLVA